MATKNLLIFNFTEELFCPICTDVPRAGPIYQCETGHVICSSCFTVVQICPSCDKTIGNTRSLLAERILAKLPKPCRFAENGCKEELLEDAIVRHEANCLFRRINCVHLYCREKVRFSNLLPHINKEHSNAPPLNNKSTLTFPLKLDSNEFKNSVLHAPFHLRHRGQDFFLEICRSNEAGTWLFWVYFVGSRADSAKYTYTLKLSHPEVSDSVTFSGGVVSVDVTKDEAKQQSMAFQLSDPAVIRLIVNETIRVEVTVFGDEQQPTFSQRIRRMFSCRT